MRDIGHENIPLFKEEQVCENTGDSSIRRFKASARSASIMPLITPIIIKI